jgi:integrase
MRKKQPTREQIRVTDEMLQAILDYWKKKGGRNWRLAYMALKLAAASGARRGELLGFTPNDLQQRSDGKYIILFKRQRRPLPRGNPDLFDTILKTERSYGGAVLDLFPELPKELDDYIRDYDIMPDKPLFDVTPRTVDNWLAQAKDALKLDPRLRLHDLISWYIAKKYPQVVKALGENNPLLIEDYLRKSLETIRRHYHRQIPPEQLMEMV